MKIIINLGFSNNIMWLILLSIIDTDLCLFLDTLIINLKTEHMEIKKWIKQVHIGSLWAYKSLIWTNLPQTNICILFGTRPVRRFLGPRPVPRFLVCLVEGYSSYMVEFNKKLEETTFIIIIKSIDLCSLMCLEK
jgi:hypothetical protein